MIEVWDFEPLIGKQVSITLNNGKVFKGKLYGFSPPDDEEDGIGEVNLHVFETKPSLYGMVLYGFKTTQIASYKCLED